MVMKILNIKRILVEFVEYFLKIKNMRGSIEMDDMDKYELGKLSDNMNYLGNQLKEFNENIKRDKEVVINIDYNRLRQTIKDAISESKKGK